VRTITFYSYKGGTGRTLLLANLARLAASAGLRVMALDFDLEAPGLAYKLLGDGNPRVGGLVGWLRDALAGGRPAALDDYAMDVATSTPFVAGGWLKLMPAGRAPSPNYFQDLRRLGLDRELDEGRGIDALLDLQEQIGSDLGTEFLLIDARTGITSTNAITTHVLADEVVVLALDTPEQLEGTRSVLRALEPLTSLRTNEPLRLHVVLSRVPPRPPDAPATGLTESEETRIQRVRAFLNEPAQPLSRTLDVQSIHLLHTDPVLQRQEFLFLEGPGEWTRSALHVDYLRIGTALFGDAVEDAAARALAEARPDAERFEELAYFFGRPEAVLEARGLRAREREPAERTEVDLGEQVDLLRGRAERDLAARLDLAALLLDVSDRMRELGQRKDALANVSEAVAIYRDLAETRPEVFLPDLATSLNNLSNRLSDLGKREEALAAIEEATKLRRELAHDRPEVFLPDLAGSLNNLSSCLSDLGKREEALAPIEEATKLYRQLAHDRPEVFLPNLAGSLNNLSLILDQLGRHEEARAASRETEELGRRLLHLRDEA
jgi:MinD-like ATPase involved in chromosome partitioning or flagellar assembly/tetratricopeptide (TPR) repeat protein